MDDINLGLYSWPRLYPLGLTTNYVYGLLWRLCLHCETSLDSFSQAVNTSHPTLTSHPPTPLATLAQNWCTPSKNNLKSYR